MIIFDLQVLFRNFSFKLIKQDKFMIFQKPFIFHNICRCSHWHAATHLVFFLEHFVLLVLFVEIGQSFRRRIFCRNCYHPLKSSHILTNYCFSRAFWITLRQFSFQFLYILLLQNHNFLFLSFYLIVARRSLTFWGI